MTVILQRNTGSEDDRNDSGILRTGARRTGPTEPGGPVLGDLWYDTVNKVLRAYDGAAWTFIGITHQASSTVGTTDGSGNLLITYGLAFSATPQCVVLTNGEDGQGVFLYSMVVRNTNNFTMKVRNTAGTAVAGALVRVNWIAMAG